MGDAWPTITGWSMGARQEVLYGHHGKGRDMNTDRSAPRLLGEAFLFVALTSLLGGVLLASAVGSGSISDMLVHLSGRASLVRGSILSQMVTSSGIVVLAGFLYIVLHRRSKNIALVALGCWLAEAMFLALSQLGVLALIPLSQDFVSAGAPQHSHYQTLGEFLYKGIYTQGYTMHMWFYCTGGILWYYQFYKSMYIPRLISLWGLLAVSVGSIGIVFQFFGYDVPIIVYIPIGPFELTLGVWLMLRGIRIAPAAATGRDQMEANERRDRHSGQEGIHDLEQRIGAPVECVTPVGTNLQQGVRST